MNATAMYPKMNPMHVCRYVICVCITIPGTLTNVTPDIEAPIMPNATMYHGDCLRPRKKVSLSDCRDVKRLSSRRRAKYAAMVKRISMSRRICFTCGQWVSLRLARLKTNVFTF